MPCMVVIGKHLSVPRKSVAPVVGTTHLSFFWVLPEVYALSTPALSVPTHSAPVLSTPLRALLTVFLLSMLLLSVLPL